MAIWRLLAVSFALGLSALGCTTLRSGTAQLPERIERASSAPILTPTSLPARSVRASQYVFFSDVELKPDTPLVKDLEELRGQIQKELKLPTATTPIQIYLFDDRDKYERFMKSRYPELPKRRAFFVAQPKTVGGTDELLVYTFWGDRVRQDLRHELTHALLHSVLKDVPLWLDEGLAEYFELPADSDGLNPQHLELLRKGPFTPDLGRLEQLSQVSQMSPAEYREAWAWVHLMLRGPKDGKQVLLGYISQLRSNPNPGPLQPRLSAALPGLNDALDMHLGQLARVEAALK